MNLVIKWVGLTKCAMDAGDFAESSGIFLASSFSFFQAEATFAEAPVPLQGSLRMQAVGWPVPNHNFLVER